MKVTSAPDKKKWEKKKKQTLVVYATYPIK